MQVLYPVIDDLVKDSMRLRRQRVDEKKIEAKSATNQIRDNRPVSDSKSVLHERQTA